MRSCTSLYKTYTIRVIPSGSNIHHRFRDKGGYQNGLLPTNCAVFCLMVGARCPLLHHRQLELHCHRMTRFAEVDASVAAPQVQRRGVASARSSFSQWWHLHRNQWRHTCIRRDCGQARSFRRGHVGSCSCHLMLFQVTFTGERAWWKRSASLQYSSCYNSNNTSPSAGSFEWSATESKISKK